MEVDIGKGRRFFCNVSAVRAKECFEHEEDLKSWRYWTIGRQNLVEVNEWAELPTHYRPYRWNK